MNTLSRNRGNQGGVLKVLLIILGLIVVIVVGAGIYVATHWKGWAADAANRVAAQIVADSGLPQAQRDSITAEIKQLGEDFKTGKITTQQLAEIAKTIGEGPLLPIAAVQAARQKYIEPSDLKAEEKASAILSLQRLARGVTEKKISTSEIDDIVKPVSEIMPNGRWKLKDHPTRMEIDQFIANAKARADGAKIPEEPFDLNIAEELKKAIHGA